MKKITRKIMLTIEEYTRLEEERYPYMYMDKTPVSDKVSRAGIDPTAGDLMINHKPGNEYITLSQERYEMSIGERVNDAYRSLLHYLGIIHSPTRHFLGYRTLKKDLAKLKKYYR